MFLQLNVGCMVLVGVDFLSEQLSLHLEGLFSKKHLQSA